MDADSKNKFSGHKMAPESREGTQLGHFFSLESLEWLTEAKQKQNKKILIPI